MLPAYQEKFYVVNSSTLWGEGCTHCLWEMSQKFRWKMMLQNRGQWVGIAPKTTFTEHLLCHGGQNSVDPGSGISDDSGHRQESEQRMVVQCDKWGGLVNLVIHSSDAYLLGSSDMLGTGHLLQTRQGLSLPCWFFFMLNFFFFFFFLVLVALGLCCGTQALHCFVHWLSLVVASGGYFLVSVCRLLIAAASLVAEQGSRPQ